MDDYIADRAKKIDASGIRKVFALASSLENPVNFSIGQPDFDVPESIKQEAIKAIQQGYNKYSQTAGEQLLREKIAGRLENEFGWEKPSVLITSGVSGGLLLAFMALINPGDEVIIPDPYFVIYKHLVNMLGGKCVFVDCYPEFNLPVEKIKKSISSKTKIIIVNSPCNPSGSVYSAKTLKKLAKAADQTDTIILSDEIYKNFSYDGPAPSIASYCEKCIITRGFSKSYGMPGWRLAYASAHPRLNNILEEMATIQQYTFVCAPTPFQKAALVALDYDINPFIASYRKKRDLTYETLKDKFEMIKPAGAFYAFVKAPGGEATQFVREAIKNNLLIIPGNVFSEKDTHFRISYATSDEKISRGIEILRSLA